MHSFNIDRNILFDALSKLVTTCEDIASHNKNFLSHFFYIRFDSDGTKISLSAQNLLRRVDVLISAEKISGPFCFGVSGKHLYSLIKSLPSDEIRINVSTSFQIVSKGSFYSLGVIEGDKFPVHTHVDSGLWFKADIDSFLKDMEKISYASFKSGDHPYMRAVSITKDNLFCSDNRRMSFVPNKYVSMNMDLLFPVDSVQPLLSLFASSEGEGFVAFDFCRIHLSKGSVYASSSLYAGVVPGFLSVMPKSECSPCIVDKALVLSALKRTLLISSDKTDYLCGELNLIDSNLCFFAETEINKAREHITCDYRGPMFKTKVNLRYLYQAIKSIVNDVVCIEIRLSEDAIIITDSKGDHKNVILPVRG